jgi:hypothetical protein
MKNISCFLCVFIACLHCSAQTKTNGPLVGIFASDSAALVGLSSGAFTITRSGGGQALPDYSTNLTVFLDINGSAVNGVDYLKINSQYTIPAGCSAVDVAIIPTTNPPTLGSRNKYAWIRIKPNPATYWVAPWGNSTNTYALITLAQDRLNLLPTGMVITQPQNNATIRSNMLVAPGIQLFCDESTFNMYSQPNSGIASTTVQLGTNSLTLNHPNSGASTNGNGAFYYYHFPFTNVVPGEYIVSAWSTGLDGLKSAIQSISIKVVK